MKLVQAFLLFAFVNPANKNNPSKYIAVNANFFYPMKTIKKNTKLKSSIKKEAGWTRDGAMCYVLMIVAVTDGDKAQEKCVYVEVAGSLTLSAWLMGHCS
jgi:hypothetical protein